ncbi:MAG: phosphoribosylformylglycinamidine synthase subunit PurS [Endomicrobia bacterium]|nr:phosphoribosylformylglycinamidine synthase subunit PurS [Endomicrobiia bacterium]
MKFLIEIIPTNKNFSELLKEINSLSSVNIKNIKVNKIYSFIGEISEEEVIFVIENLLLDPLVEKYRFYKEKIDKKTNATIINIWYKPAVLDVVANTISNAIKYLGINRDIEIHSGTQIEIRPSLNEKFIKEFLEKTFINPLIQYYEAL